MKSLLILPVLCALGLGLSVQLAAAQSTIFLVRHAEKAQDGDKDNPSLSEEGRARATALARMLKDAKITAIYVTEYQRTQQTAAPTAEVAKAKVKEVAAKDIPKLIRQLKDEHGSILVVGHTNTLPRIIKALGFPEPAKIDEDDYDNLFVVSRAEKPQLLRLHYR